MQTKRDFNGDITRYEFDFIECHFKLGYAQVDTGQDASCFGTWANPTTLTIVNYCEGDICRQIADDPQEFCDELRKIKDWNETQGYGFKGIDPMCVSTIEGKFRDLGLADLLYANS